MNSWTGYGNATVANSGQTSAAWTDGSQTSTTYDQKYLIWKSTTQASITAASTDYTLGSQIY